MSELKAMLDAFASGQTTFEALSTSFDRYLSESSTDAPEVLKTLKQARDAGLPHHVFVALSSKLHSSRAPRKMNAPASAEDFAKTVRMTVHPGEDATDISPDRGTGGTTRIRPGPARPAQGTSGPRDPDATVLGGGDDSTEVNAGEVNAGEVNAGEVNAGVGAGGPTRVRPRPARPAQRSPGARDPDATVLGSGNDDSTEVNGETGTVGSTRLRPGPARPAQRAPGPRDPDATVLGSGNDDSTEVNAVAGPVEDVTAVNPEPGPDLGADSDATVLASDEGADRTVLAEDFGEDADAGAAGTERGGGAPARDADATVFAGDDDEATAVNAAPPDDEAATAVNVPASGRDDVTAVNAAGATGADDNDATAVNALAEGNGDGAAGADDGFDILDPDAMAAAAKSAESSQTGTSWPKGEAAAETESARDRIREYGAGDRLRGRFELISKLGEGGMGAVWKAKDLLKEEARDRNPFVAVKLLTGDFKQHPEAFIALQRETSKQQRLAHPNIATVYDFDRDGDTVYMTMEVMEGQPLDAFVRKLPADGLPEEEAMKLIEQLAAGLSYAHQAKLVHSDLKPGNCFLTKDSTVKLLDFGIARASKTTTDAQGETTVFDPGQLGALTPTYATIEMFEGQEPDPRDDIYALAIIAYQLFTGKHPYGKQSAPKAKDQGLVPAPVPKLNKRQNKGLRHGLAFLREDRTATVDQFLDEIRRKKSRAPAVAAAVFAALAIIAALSYKPINDYLDARRNEEIISRIATGDESKIVAALQTVSTFGPDSQRTIKEDDRARKAIFNLYVNKAEEAFDVARNRFDFATAQKYLGDLKRLYPDSAQVLRVEDSFNTQKDNELSKLNDRYNQLLEKGRIVPVKGQEDIGDVLKIVAQIDPKNPLLHDRQLPIRYADLAKEAIKNKDYQRADQILSASVAYAPDDATLTNMRYEVKAELKRQQNEALVAQIEERLKSRQASLKSLSDFQQVRDDLIKLSDLRPESPVLASLQDALKKAFSDEMNRDVKTAAWDKGEELIADYAKLLQVPFLIEQRRQLSDAEQQAGYQIPMTAQRREAVADNTKQLDDLLGKPDFSGDWELALKLHYKQLIALVPSGDPSLQKVRGKIVSAYLDKAKESRAANRFTEALAFVERGQTLVPGVQDFKVERDAIAAAEDALRKQQEEERRLARLDALKRTLIAKANANQPQEAKKILEELRAGLPADDPFLAKDGPQAIAQAYLRLAEGVAKQEHYDEAVKLVQGGLEVAPGLKPLEDALKVYTGEQQKLALVTRLRKLFDSTVPLNTKEVAGELKTVDSQFPDHKPLYSDQFAALRATRIKSMDLSAPDRLGAVEQRLAEYKSLFPAQETALRRDVEGDLAKTIKSLESKDLAKAHELLAKAKETLPGGPVDSIKLKPLPKPSELAAQGIKQVEAYDLSAAQQTLAKVEKETPDALNLPDLRQKLQQALQQPRSDYQNYLKYKAAGRAVDGKPFLDRALAYWKDNTEYQKEMDELKKKVAQSTIVRGECSPGLAGFGTRAQGVCYDMIASGERGPEMVVVPAGGGHGKPFAIGKYEVSVRDYNNYCKLSGKCKPHTGVDSDLPITGISVKDAENYAAWLSQRTKARYRLPTASEWQYAAEAGGDQPQKDFNCRVVLGTQVLKGQSLVSVRSGRQNGWGLANYVGNAQEWVTGGSGVEARGGDYEDPLSKCDISLSRPQSGRGDGVTGFRLVRELG